MSGKKADEAGTIHEQKCKGDNLVRFKRKLTLRQGLRRHVNELISSVNFTWRAREIGADGRELRMARQKHVIKTRESKSAATSPQAAVAPDYTPTSAIFYPPHAFNCAALLC